MKLFLILISMKHESTSAKSDNSNLNKMWNCVLIIDKGAKVEELL